MALYKAGGMELGRRAVPFCSDYREGAVISGVTGGGPPGPACPAEVVTKAEGEPRGTAQGVGIPRP